MTLSYAQERLWFLHRLDPGDPSYNTAYAYRLRGDLDLARLEAAFTAVAARHEALRTRFPEVDGRPVAVVEPPGRIAFEIVEVDPEKGDPEKLVAERTNAPFDLAARPPFTVTVVRIGPRDHVLCVVLHHINGDGWSFNVLREEVAACYAGRPLPDDPPQFDPRLRDPAAGDDLDWWAERLAGTPVLELPADRPRPPQRGTAGGEVLFHLPPELVARVAELARAARCTPYMVLLAAYQVLLARHSGQRDFCVGAPSAGRTSTELERVIGYLSTTMVLRCDLSGEPTFSEVLRRTRRAVLQGLARQEVPFGRLVGALGLDRDLSRTPLFQTMFALHTQGEIDEPVPGVAAEPFPMGWSPARCDLSLDLYDLPDGRMLGVAIYSEDLFDRATVERLMARFTVLVSSVVADPGLPIAELDLLPQAERDLLAAWNDTAADLPAVTLVDLVTAQAERTPGAVAVVCGDTSLTYGELVGRAGRLAGALRERDIGRGSLVAVRLSRGADMLVALLGVAMSGAAYLPVDPDYPPARVSYVLEDSGAALVLTDGELPSAAPGEPGEPAPVLTPPRPDDTAYVLYTSGSTGHPKGVVIPHRALTNFLLAMGSLVGSRPTDVWLALTSLSFDISALELYLPLITGGTVAVADAETARDGAALSRLIADHGVTHVQATPSGWRVLLTGDLPPLTALAGGEPLPARLAAELRARVDRLLNMYGPTETTIWSTAWEVPRDPDRVTIGRPIANTTVHVDAPIGVPGELLIGGAGLAAGYLGRPDLTAERFVRYGGERVYRTGDLVRLLPDGTLEFLGRTDHQVKLRGHRIELGEIETVLETHPGVAQAVAAVQDDRLVAFVVGDPAGVKEHAAARLPGTMVPASIVALEALPLTPNGKVDRAALPAAGVVAPRAVVPPRTPHERLVAGVFADVLGVPEVGADDDFFALGGHSLLATVVTSRLPVEVPVRELFLRPTVAALAALLDAPAGEEGPRPRPAGTPVPLTRNQERLWFLHRLDPGDAAYNMWIVRRLRGPLDVAALGRALDALAARHESLRTRFPEADGVPYAVVEPPGRVPVEVVGAQTGQDAEKLVAERVNAPFDLAAAPPFRVTLVGLGAGDHVLCVVLHHMIGDGWSLNVLLDDLAALYSGRPLPELPLRFGDVARWQLTQDSMAGYWADRLAGRRPLTLPADRPPGEGPRRAAFHTLRLPVAAVARVRGATMFMTLMAAYQAVLAAHSGQRDICVATVTSGRDRAGLDGVVGYFADTVVIRGDLTGASTFGEIVERVRDTVMDAFAHQGAPLERAPSFETMAILHTQDAGRVPGAFAALAAEPFPHGFAQVKFDLMLEAWQDPDELTVVLSYDAALFEAATIEAMAARLERVLLQDPALPPQLLTGGDLALLRSWGKGPALAEVPSTPERLARAVREHAGLPAVGELTYAAFDRRVTELAGLLQAKGVRRGDLVGVCLGRSSDAVAALAAVWRAGAAYLPLDPGHPPARLGHLLADSGAVLVLTSIDLADRLPEGTPLACTCEPAAPPTPVAPGETAYVLYTSGSTGTPKGVVVTHRNLAARVAWMAQEYGLGPGDRIVQFASLGFDTHAEEIYPALVSGAHVTVLPDGAVTLPGHLDGVTVLDLPTAYWHHLVDQLDAVSWPPTLRLVILGGEQAHAAAVARWRARFGDRVRLVNTYGPTEATIIATATDLDGSPGLPPIGRPIAGTTAYVVDAEGRLAPPGAPGELCVGGAGVAAGYLGLPELTAARFVSFTGDRLAAPVEQDAYGQRHQRDQHGRGGERVYRTGDRARWRGDGRLEFLGRLDDQVKVRGYRIEPGEVEARIMTHPGVGAAAVAASGDTLTGYVTGEADPRELHDHLAATLPPYLVPTRWVRLDRLPLTPNGKVDRAALPEPEAVHADYRPPSTDAEHLVAGVFAKVLDVDKAGVHDDFFALGGHSLLAVRVVARIRAAIDLDVPIRTLFARPTVGALARAVEDLLVAELDQMSDEEAERLARELT
ncbi:amino acid adenylation domain-containing protein [Nonomuraea sp. NPDC003804]|uniref:amino acid adenylation domain-containing protein n=1 Tax=Nonomuraea sp. NPDC003804 TaxID=3154547 RepID=UPI00339DFAF4